MLVKNTNIGDGGRPTKAETKKKCMTEQEIAKEIDPTYLNVYAVTYAPTTLYFKDGSIKVGFFQPIDETEMLRKQNIFTFVEFGENAQNFKATMDKKYVTKINGNDLVKVVYPLLRIVEYNQVFTINPNGTISPRIPVRIGGITMGPGVSFGSGVLIGGLNLIEFKNRNIQGYVDNGMFVIKGFCSCR